MQPEIKKHSRARIHLLKLGLAILLASLPGWKASGALGGRIAYGCNDAQGTTIRVFDTATGETTVIPINASLIPNAGSPDWTPDGQWIVFNGNEGNGPSSQVYAIRPDGTGFRRITGGSGNLVMPDVSPDGTRVAYHQVYGNVSVINFDGTGWTDLGYGIGGVDWSPDGQRLVGTDWAHVGGYNSDLWIWDVTTGAKDRITHRPEGTAYVWPSWSPDGSKIAASFRQNGQWDVVLMNLDGSAMVNLTADWSWDADEAAWSPDGQYIVFTSGRAGGGTDIWYMRPDGSEKTLLISGNGAFLNSPAITPVPEPRTIIAGALLLLPFGASALRKLRKSRKA